MFSGTFEDILLFYISNYMECAQKLQFDKNDPLGCIYFFFATFCVVNIFSFNGS